MQVMSTGGVYVGGGIAPKNLDLMKSGKFMEAFLDKGPLFRPILQKMPVYVVTEQKTGLLGAAQYAFAHGKAQPPQVAAASPLRSRLPLRERAGVRG